MVDAGNLIQNGTPDFLATAKYPYGMTYFGKPTGRCSDGRLVIDFICKSPFLWRSNIYIFFGVSIEICLVFDCEGLGTIERVL